jgi:hypothetical protein
MSDDNQIIFTQGFIVACMECHNGKPEAVDTLEEAQRLAKIHLSVTGKPHGDHTVTITPTTLVRRKK